MIKKSRSLPFYTFCIPDFVDVSNMLFVALVIYFSISFVFCRLRKASTFKSYRVLFYLRPLVVLVLIYGFMLFISTITFFDTSTFIIQIILFVLAVFGLVGFARIEGVKQAFINFVISGVFLVISIIIAMLAPEAFSSSKNVGDYLPTQDIRDCLVEKECHVDFLESYIPNKKEENSIRPYPNNDENEDLVVIDDDSLGDCVY